VLQSSSFLPIPSGLTDRSSSWGSLQQLLLNEEAGGLEGTGVRTEDKGEEKQLGNKGLQRKGGSRRVQKCNRATREEKSRFVGKVNEKI
jgi:hypothetical protein